MRLNPSPAPDHHFVRAVSRWELVVLAVNDVVGSGVYLLPAAAALYLGASSPWAVLLAGVSVCFLVLCFAEAGSRFDQPGSAYLYTRAAFGDFVGFEVGWMTWLSRIASVATLSVGFVQAMEYLWNGASTSAGRALLITVPLLALTGINVVGVKHGARTSVFLTLVKMAPLLVLIGAGALALPWPTVLHTPLPSRDGLAQAALLILFAYGGFENTAAAAGEFKNPRRDVPFALVVQIALVTALYSLIQIVVVLALPAAGSSRTPLAEAAQALMGPAGGLLLTAGAAVSILGTNSNIVLSGPRYLYALGERHPQLLVFARLHPRYRTPYVAILTQTALTIPLALSGTFAGLAALSVLARFATYIGTAGAVLVLRRTMPATDRTVRLPGGPLIPTLAIGTCLLFLSAATGTNLLAAGVALAAGAVVYLAGAGRVARRSLRLRETQELVRFEDEDLLASNGDEAGTRQARENAGDGFTARADH